jgi:hypothetical protein
MHISCSLTGSLILSGIVVASAIGCRTAGNSFSKLESAAPVAKPIATVETPRAAEGPAGSGVAANEPPWKSDPPYGYYPKDDGTDEIDTSVPASRFGSLPTNSSAGYTAGCCPH